MSDGWVIFLCLAGVILVSFCRFVVVMRIVWRTNNKFSTNANRPQYSEKSREVLFENVPVHIYVLEYEINKRQGLVAYQKFWERKSGYLLFPIPYRVFTINVPVVELNYGEVLVKPEFVDELIGLEAVSRPLRWENGVPVCRIYPNICYNAILD